MRLSAALVIVLALASIAGCDSIRPYRLNIQQGNYLDSDDVAKVEVGMTRGQVHFLLGTPMVADPFHPERWDYVFFFKVGRTRNEIKSQMTVWFEDDRVVKVQKPDSIDPMADANKG
jgi:outer membrane protein assembly factor BamE